MMLAPGLEPEPSQLEAGYAGGFPSGLMPDKSSRRSLYTTPTSGQQDSNLLPLGPEPSALPK